MSRGTRERWTAEQLPLAVERVNYMRQALNAVREDAAAAIVGSKKTAAGVDKRAREKVQAILDAANVARPHWFHWYLSAKNYTADIVAKIDAPTGEFSVTYAEETAEVAQYYTSGAAWSAPTHQDDLHELTLAGVKAGFEAVRKAEAESDAALDRANSAKNIGGLWAFID